MDEEKRIPGEGWEEMDRNNVMFDKRGRVKFLGTCKRCGGNLWLKQWGPLKNVFVGKCHICGNWMLARVKRVDASLEECRESECRVRDVQLMASHLIDVAIREMDPVIYDAAETLMELEEKHWSECWQIGVYSDTDEKAQRLVRATTMEPLTVDGVKESVKAVKTIWTESDLDKLSPDDGTVRYYTD